MSYSKSLLSALSPSRIICACLLGVSLGVMSAANAETVELRLEPSDEGSPISDDLRNSLNDALPDEDEAPSTLFQAKRQGNRAADAIRDTLNSQGYFDPDIESFIESGDQPVPVVRVDPGRLFRLAEIDIDYGPNPPSEADRQVAMEAVQLRAGDTAIPLRIIDQERVLISALRDRGYAFASASDRSVLGDREAAELEVRYNINAGPRVRFGKVIYPEDVRTKDLSIRLR